MGRSVRPRVLDDHGFLAGWEARARDTLRRVCVTQEGRLVAAATGRPLVAEMSHEEFADMGLDAGRRCGGGSARRGGGRAVVVAARGGTQSEPLG